MEEYTGEYDLDTHGNILNDWVADSLTGWLETTSSISMKQNYSWEVTDYKFPSIQGNLKLHYRPHKSRHWFLV
jgi:hypothetical protein